MEESKKVSPTRNMFCVLLNLIAFMSCSLIFNTVNVTVPKGYQGWCYVIPVKDTTGFAFEVSPDAMAGISSNALKGMDYQENRVKYNSKELQNKEFGDGSPLLP